MPKCEKYNYKYHYHDYSAYGLVAKAISHFLVIIANAIIIGPSHNVSCILQLESDIYIYNFYKIFKFLILVLYYYNIKITRKF